MKLEVQVQVSSYLKNIFQVFSSFTRKVLESSSIFVPSNFEFVALTTKYGAYSKPTLIFHEYLQGLLRLRLQTMPQRCSEDADTAGAAANDAALTAMCARTTNHLPLQPLSRLQSLTRPPLPGWELFIIIVFLSSCCLAATHLENNNNRLLSSGCNWLPDRAS